MTDFLNNLEKILFNISYNINLNNNFIILIFFNKYIYIYINNTIINYNL